MQSVLKQDRSGTLGEMIARFTAKIVNSVYPGGKREGLHLYDCVKVC